MYHDRLGTQQKVSKKVIFPDWSGLNLLSGRTTKKYFFAASQSELELFKIASRLCRVFALLGFLALLVSVVLTLLSQFIRRCFLTLISFLILETIKEKRDHEIDCKGYVWFISKYLWL